MTTDKLPDVVWIHHDYPWTFEDSEDNVFDGSIAYVRRALLDAMTAERDAVKLAFAEAQLLAVTYRDERDAAERSYSCAFDQAMENGYNANMFRDERDSAREALAKACEVVREYLECDRLMQMDGCPDDRFSPALTALRALAAQPETKP